MIYSEKGAALLTSKLPLSGRTPPFPLPNGCSPSLVDQLSPAAGSAEGARFLLTRNCVHLPCSHPGLASGLQPGLFTPMTVYPSPPAQLSYRGMGGQDRIPRTVMGAWSSKWDFAVSALCLSESVLLASASLW